MFETVINPWEVEEADFPAHAVPAVKWRFLLAYAVVAPSIRNTQPWRFSIHGDTVELFADRSHALPTADPNQRELIISCGAALFHLRLALWHFGYRDTVEMFRDPNNPDLLARVRMSDGRKASPQEQMLFRAIQHRHTQRAPFADRPIPFSVQADLQAAASDESAWLQLLDQEEKRVVSCLIAEATRQQWASQQFRNEITSWIHPRGARDGLSGYHWGLRPLIMRTFNLGGHTATHEQHLATTAPLLAILGTASDELVDWLQAGQALARVLLFASVNDLSASFMNQPIEVLSLRNEVQAVAKCQGFPQLILRIGPGSVQRATPRRMVIESIN